MQQIRLAELAKYSRKLEERSAQTRFESRIIREEILRGGLLEMGVEN